MIQVTLIGNYLKMTDLEKNKIKDKKQSWKKQEQDISTNLSAGDYNNQARQQGREDWRTAYRKDILKINDNENDPSNFSDQWNISKELNKEQIQDRNKNFSDQKIINENKEVWIENKKNTDVPQTIAEWKKAWSDRNTLEEMIEKKYWTVAEYSEKQDKITATIWEDKYEWNIDKAWNPIKTKVWNINEVENKKAEFSQILASNSKEEIKKYLVANSSYVEDFKPLIRESIKNKENQEFFNKYSSLGEEELYEEVKNWNVVVWSEKYNLLSPEQRASFESYKKEKEIIDAWDKTDFEKLNNNFLSFNDILKNQEAIFSSNIKEKREQLLNSPELTKNRWDIEKLQGEIQKVDELIAKIDDEVEKEYRGLPSSLLESEKIERYENLYLKKVTLQWALNIKNSSYENLKSDIKSEIELMKYEDWLKKQQYMSALSLYKYERGRMDERQKTLFNEQNKKYSQEKQFENQKELLRFKNQMEEQNKSWGKYLDDWEWNLVYVINWEKISVLEWMWEKILVDQDNDYTYETYSKDGVTTVIWIPKKKGLSITHETFDVNWERVSAPMQLQTAIAKCWEDGKQCGQWVNDYLENIWGERIFWDSYESKVASINSDVPMLWWMAVWNPWITDEQKKYGHVWIVTWIEWDILEITDWNWKWDEKKMVHKVPRSQIEYNGGYYNPEWIGKKDVEIEWYDKQDIPLYKDFYTKWLTKAQQDPIWDYEEFKLKALNYQKELNQQWTAQKEKVIWIAQELLSFIDEKEISRSKRMYSNTAPDFLKTGTLSDYQSKLESLISNLSLDNLVELKSQGATFWALSNQELNFIKQSATELKWWLSDKAFRGEINRIIKVLSSWLSEERKKELWISNKSDNLMNFTTSSWFKLNYWNWTNKNLYEWFFNE